VLGEKFRRASATALLRVGAERFEGPDRTAARPHRAGTGRADECPDSQDKIAANNQIDASLAKVLVLTENYPQLRSSDQFMRLQDELSGTENRISVARKRYNDSIQDYNTFILQFPNSVWAGIAGFHQNNAYFAASPAAQNVPNVSF